MAVVYPIPFGADGVFGGGERYALEYAKALSRHTPTRLVTFGRRRTARRYREGSLIIDVYPWLHLVRGERSNPLSFSFLASLRGVDIIHCLSWHTLVTDLAILYARLARKRVYVTDVGGGGSLSLARWTPIARLVDGFLLIAEQGGNEFISHRSKWSIIYAGVDPDLYKPVASPVTDSVLFVGRILPHKGVNYLIEAVDPGTPLVIVGRPYDQRYVRMLRQLSEGKDVTFVTEASDEEVVRRYQTSLVTVLPSVRDNVYGEHTDFPELLGFTAMEAMACGRPVICSNVGALSELVVDGVTGYLVPPNDPIALRDRIRVLQGDPDLAARLGTAARRRILDRFTWEAVAERCLSAYAARGSAPPRSLLKASSGPRDRLQQRDGGAPPRAVGPVNDGRKVTPLVERIASPAPSAEPDGNRVANEEIFVLLYSWVFHPTFGGLSNLTAMMAVRLQRDGNHVVVVTATPDPDRRAGPQPFRVVRRPGLIELVRLVRQADVVHLNTFNISIAVIAAVLRRPIVWQHIDFDTVSPRGICYRLGRPCPGKLPECYRCLGEDHSQRGVLRAIASLLVRRLFVHLVQANCVSTDYAQQRMRLRSPVMIPFGIDTAWFTPVPRDPPPPLRVFFHGRHVKDKGCDVLVRAVRVCVDRSLYIVVRVAGDGPHRAISESLAGELEVGDYVSFLGQLDDEEIVHELQQTHVLVVPSIQDEIGLLVTLEGMSCGAVVAASDLGAIPEHTRDSGLLFPAGDHIALADHLIGLARDPQRIVDLGAAARHRAEVGFDASMMGQRFEALYRSVLRSRHRTPS